MIPLALFLLGCAAIYAGTVQAAFSTVLRMQLRLIAEGSDQAPGLDRYLQDPLRLFVPVRAIQGIIEGLTVVLLARLVGLGSWGSLGVLALALLAFGGICEFLVPFVIVVRDPERVLAWVLPSFRVVSRPFEPLTLGVVHLVSRRKRDRVVAVANGGEPPADDSAPSDSDRQTPDDSAATNQEERKLLRSIVDFSETLVREVMTPRPDIVAIRADSTIRQLTDVFREQEYSRIPVYKENLDNILGFVFVKDLDPAGGRGARAEDDGRPHPPGVLRP